jgi:hypothetical protein
MKCIKVIIALLSLTACNNDTGRNMPDEKVKTLHADSLIQVDSLYIDSNEINGAGGRPYKEL